LSGAWNRKVHKKLLMPTLLKNNLVSRGLSARLLRRKIGVHAPHLARHLAAMPIPKVRKRLRMLNVNVNAL
jgi:hypothetical protein